MRVLCRHRRWLSGWLIGFLLFAQWATASYSCPQQGGQSDAAAPAVAMAAVPAATMAAMPDCAGGMPGMDPDQPQLCKAHCEAGRQSVNSGGATPDVPPALALTGVLGVVVELTDEAGVCSAVPAATAAGPPRGTPPLYLSLLVLRN
jgi:hypothetical protein